MKWNFTMKAKMTLKLAALTSVVAITLFAGCKKQETHSEPDGHDHGKAAAADHSGQDHAKTTNSPAADDHSGHNHAPGEHAPAPAK
jgi:hypothetical protein